MKRRAGVEPEPRVWAKRPTLLPDALIGEGGAVASVSALYGPDSDRPQRLGLYGGVGGGVYSVEDIL